MLSMNTPLNIVNSENKILVMNVINAPTDFTIQSQIHYNNRVNHETEDFSDANISWNFPSNVTNLAINAPFKVPLLRHEQMSQPIKIWMEQSSEKCYAKCSNQSLGP